MIRNVNLASNCDYNHTVNFSASRETVNRQSLTKISVQALFQCNDLNPLASIGYEMIDHQQGAYH